jgi:hypothetical protein
MSIDVPDGEQGLSAVYAATTVAEIVRFSTRKAHAVQGADPDHSPVPVQDSHFFSPVRTGIPGSSIRPMSI